MPATARPRSPHSSIYRWQIQMVTSIVHRATGIFLAVGTILVCSGLVALAWSDTVLLAAGDDGVVQLKPSGGVEPTRVLALDVAQVGQGPVSVPSQPRRWASA